MESVIIPFGLAGWEQRTRFIEELLRSRPAPPYKYDDILILVPSSRMKRTYGKLFVNTIQRLYGAASLVQPVVQTFDDFFMSLYAHVNGPLPISKDSRLVLLEGIVKDRLSTSFSFSLSPDLLAPSLSSELAETIKQLSGAGVGHDDLALKIQGSDFSDKQQVKLLMDVLGRYESVLREANLTDPAGMRAFLRDRFDPSWLANYHMIIIEGIREISAIEGDILRKLAADSDCAWRIDAPSAEILKRANESHPLRVVQDSLGLIGLIPGEEGAHADADELFLAQALFSDRSFDDTARKAPTPSSFHKELRLLSAVTMREEVSLIARNVKRSLRGGAAADSILVTFPALDEYGPLVEEIFADHGIPYNRALDRQLSTSPVITAVISLLRACREDFSGPSLLRIFSSPFLKFAGRPSITPALDRLMRDQRIIGGRQKLLSALKYHTADKSETDILSEPLTDLFSALEPFSGRDAAPLSSWMERLANLIAWAGPGARVSTIKGPLNINLQAYKKLNETLSSLAIAGKQFPEYRYTFSEWLFLLKKTFMQTRFQVPSEDEGGVQLLGLEESLEHPWEEIYFGGLVDGKFPRRLPQNIFLPEQTLEAMGVRTIERARLNAAYHFYRLILSAPKVTLTYPENEGDKPVVPSPFLEELTPLKKAGLINRGIEKTSGIQFSLKISESNSIPELAKAISIAGAVKGLDTVFCFDIEGMPAIKSATEYKPAGSIPAVIPSARREFSVTELDDYLSCPYDYYIRHVLKIQPLEEVSEDISPLDRGSKVHGILKKFYDGAFGKRPITRENRDEARTVLKKLADAAFDREADTFRNRREKERFVSVMAERFLDAEEEFWKQGMRPEHLEQKIERYRLVLSSGEEVDISAKIDRIDVDESGNFIIVDYKTGDYPESKKGVEQKIFQLPVYAVMARQSLNVGARHVLPAEARHALPLRKPIGLAYYDLKGKYKGSARDVVLYNNEARDDHPVSKPQTSPKSAEDFETILEQSMDKARKAVEGILAGVFPASPQDDNKCRYCPNEMMCEKESTT